MKRPEELYLSDIVQSARHIAEFIAGAPKEQFLEDRRSQSAVLWELMILSEACAKIEPGTREAFRAVPWQQIRAFRNRLAHGYFTLEWDKVWQIASGDVPELANEAERILSALGLGTRNTSEEPERESGDSA